MRVVIFGTGMLLAWAPIIWFGVVIFLQHPPG
jgi:hypothetical protein